jgi:dihydrolipoamide dehydrogenase
MTDRRADLVVVGGGPGGYTAAIRAAQLGLDVTLVEERHLGGICLNWGCIPTKALLRTSGLYREMLHATEFGIAVEGLTFDLSAVVERSRVVAAQLSNGIVHLLKKNKVTVLDGRAGIRRPGLVAVTAGGDEIAEVAATNVIVATGARPRMLPELEAHRRFVWTYMDALAPDVLPASLLIVGAGAIGIEFASFYRTLGVDVTTVEALPRILPAEDAEIAGIAQELLAATGIRFLTGTRVAGATSGADTITVTVEEANGASHDLTVERVLSAVGVVGNVEDLGLEGTAVRVERGAIETDRHARTGEPTIFAVGDVAGPPMLAHKAQHEGIACVESIAGHEQDPADDNILIPRCVYSHPQVASVGLTEDEAAEAGYDVKVGRFPFRGNGKAIAVGSPDGIVKTIFDAHSGQLLGAHLVGTDVTELIQGLVIAMNLETTETDLIRTVFPHPTLSEAMHESVLDAYGRAIHV